MVLKNTPYISTKFGYELNKIKMMAHRTNNTEYLKSLIELLCMIPTSSPT